MVTGRRRLSLIAANVGIALVAIGGLVVLALAVAYYSGDRWACSGNKPGASRAQVNKVAGAVTVYWSDNELPKSLDVLVEARLVKAKQLNDPWGNRLQYWVLPGQPDPHFVVCSNGADGEPGGGDDICND